MFTKPAIRHRIILSIPLIALSLHATSAQQSDPVSSFDRVVAIGYSTSDSFASAVIQEVASSAGLSASLLEANSEEAIWMLRNGTADAVAGASDTTLPAPGLACSIPFYIDEFVTFARTGSSPAEHARATVALVASFDASASFLASFGPEINMLHTASPSDALMMVSKSEADFAVVPRLAGLETLKKLGIRDIKPVGRAFYPVEFRFMVQEADTRLLFLLNEAIDDLLRSGWIEEEKARRGLTGDETARPGAPAASFFLHAMLGILGIVALARSSAAIINRRRDLVTLRHSVDTLRQVLDALPQRISWTGHDLAFQGSVGNWNPETSASSEELAADRMALAGESRTLVIRHGEIRVKSMRLPLRDGHGSVVGIVRVDEDGTECDSSAETLRELSSALAETRLKCAHIAVVDPQSGLFSRRHLIARLDEETLSACRYGTPVSVIAIDLADLLRAAQAGGCDAEDSALCQAIATVRLCLRNADIPGRLSAGRLLVVLPLTSQTEADTLAESMMAQDTHDRQNTDEPRPALRLVALEYSGQGTKAFIFDVERTLFEPRPLCSPALLRT